MMKKETIATIISFMLLAGMITAAMLTSENSKENSGVSHIFEGVPEDWKTYANEEYGYSIDYPDGWYAREEKAISQLYLATENTLPQDWPSVEIEIHILYLESTEKPLYWSSGVAPEDPNKVTEQGYSINIVSYRNTENFSLDQYIKGLFGKYGTFTSQKVLMGRLGVIEAHENDGFISYLPHYFLEHENYIYEIRCRDEKSNLADVAKQIVQGFSFIKR